MLGLFDSGSGGLNTVRYLKENAPWLDLVYLIDRERAPYGIKTEKELVKITEENIERLKDMGAECVLIACCTASTVHHLLRKEQKEMSIPIIGAVANAAKNATRIGRIGVIGTNHTVGTHAFKNALIGYEVHEIATGDLVGMIDGGLCDEVVTDTDAAYINTLLSPLFEKDIDTLILGCTHFPALGKTIKKIARPHGINTVIDSVKIGAELLMGKEVITNG